MELQAGGQLGHYRLIEKIGQGGMGVVWRAVDSTLDREVAIKVLPDLFSTDRDRLARFEREAKVLASLNHAGIATIHALHEIDGVRFLAMELAPGRNLASRIAEGPIPIDEALDIARQIATALEAAHESGVVHRDLKPANIQVSAEGRVKILDFGLAKALDPAAGSEGGSLSPTLTTPATRAGVVMGTAAYMSPEQAKGKSIDRRADIWAFGCVLYEMVTGRRPFGGDGVSEILAAVIMAPPDMTAMPASVPVPIRRLTRRCLEKDPTKRLRDVGEARLIIEEVLAGTIDPEASLAALSSPAAAPAGASRRRLAVLLAGVAVAASAVAAGVVWSLRPEPAAPPVRRFSIAANGPFVSSPRGALVTISPDGSRIAYHDRGRLLIRGLDRLDPIVVPLRAEPVYLFWSPDSAWLAFAAEGKLWKVPAGGGEPTVLLEQPGASAGGSGATWAADGRIVLSRGEAGLYEAPARGGDFRKILAPAAGVEDDFHQPCALPDGSILFVAHRSRGRPDQLSLLAGDRRKDLLRVEGQSFWHPVWSPSGHILYRREPANAGIWALPFSLSRHEVTGEPYLLVPDGDVPSVSADGTLVHVRSANLRQTEIVWADREGRIMGKIGQPRSLFPFPALSPDGRLVAISEQEGERSDIWIHDAQRGTRTRLTFSQTGVTMPEWSPTGDRIAYEEGAAPPFDVLVTAADGTGKPRKVGEGFGSAFSPDGRYLVFTGQFPDTTWDPVWLDLREGAEPKPIVRARGMQAFPRVSPDGRFVAYFSNETGIDQVFLTRFPGGEGKWQVSVDGGNWPHWNGRGDRLYYAARETIMEVDFTAQPEVRLGRPRALFTRKPLSRSLPIIFGWPPGFDVTPDGERFVFCQVFGDEQVDTGVIVVQNWSREPGR